MSVVPGGSKAISVLLIGDYAKEDEVLIRGVCGGLGWKVTSGDGCADVPGRPECSWHIVIAQSDLPNGNWIDVLREIQVLGNPPQLIVTSRTADDRLWAEVLNLGGYDVLAQPLDRGEVERVVVSAARHFAEAAAANGIFPAQTRGVEPSWREAR